METCVCCCTSSKEARDTSLALDSARSSATAHSGISSLSSLTHVTGIDDDALRSARGSLMNGSHTTNMTTSQSMTSPHSSLTVSPGSSRDVSTIEAPVAGRPLIPPAASDQTLYTSSAAGHVTSKSATSTSGADDLIDLATNLSQPQLPLAAKSKTKSEPMSPAHSAHGTDHVMFSHVMDFVTSSPASRGAQRDFKPPAQCEDDVLAAAATPTATVPDVDVTADVTTTTPQQPQQRAKLSSTNSSSSTSLEVSEILEGAKKPKTYLDQDDDEEDKDDDADDDVCEEEPKTQEDAPVADDGVGFTNAAARQYSFMFDARVLLVFCTKT